MVSAAEVTKYIGSLGPIDRALLSGKSRFRWYRQVRFGRAANHKWNAGNRHRFAIPNRISAGSKAQTDARPVVLRFVLRRISFHRGWRRGLLRRIAAGCLKDYCGFLVGLNTGGFYKLLDARGQRRSRWRFTLRIRSQELSGRSNERAGYIPL